MLLIVPNKPGTRATRTMVDPVQKVQQVPWFKYLEVVVSKKSGRVGGVGAGAERSNSRWVKELNLKHVKKIFFN